MRRAATSRAWRPARAGLRESAARRRVLDCRLTVVAGVLSMLLVPVGVLAQEASDCTLLDNPTRTVRIDNQGTAFESWYITQAVIVCDGGRRIVGETATYSVANGLFTLNGNVQVDDPERSLRSEFAQYFTDTQQLHARTRVVLREKASGSLITSELLDVYEATPGRESLLVASGGRPRAIMFQGSAGEGAVAPAPDVPDEQAVRRPPTFDRGAPRDSMILDAQEIRITGGQAFRGTGSAVLRRDSLTATGHAIEYSDMTRRLEIMGDARVELPTQELRGDSITATVNEQDEIDSVLARQGASLNAEDLLVTAPAIRMFLADGGVERLVAMPWQAPAGADPGPRPHVESEAFSMDADSIDVLAPGQQISEAVAIGNARGERVLPDSLQALLPETTPEILALLSRDWMRGDTVRARFAPNPRAETDSTAASTVMEQLAAHGDQAQSMYSVVNENDPNARLAFNYLVSTYIEVNFIDGEVGTVSAAGDARGVYLQPSEAARATTGGTVSAAPPPER